MSYTGRRRSFWYPVIGVILSLGAPAGLLVLRELYVPKPLLAELSSDRLTYVYVFVSTAIVMATIGFLLGRQTDRLATLSETDMLTGLPNRRALRHRLTEELHRSTRYEQPVSLMLIDIDGLKQVNDTEGHAAGDRMIRDVAAAIARCLRESDFGARWGGDEFAVVAPSADAEAARLSAERLVGLVPTLTRQHRKRPVTISIGTATYDPLCAGKVTDLATLVQAADEALYRAKAGGRNRVHAA